MSLDYLELEDGEFEPDPGRREKDRFRPRNEEELRGRKDRWSRRERIRRIRKSHTRY